MKNLSQVTLDKIKKQNITPVSRWNFVFKNYLLWLAGIVSVFVGGLISSIVFYMLINSDWDIYEKMITSPMSSVFVIMPFFWLIFLVIFIFLADYYFKNTKHGYRLSLVKVIILNIFISFILGGLFCSVGMGEALDDKFSSIIPGYNNLTENREKFWMQPSHGLLIGVITEIENNHNFIIKDSNGDFWKIESDDALIRRAVNFVVGTKIKIIGQVREGEIFTAKEIRPCFGGGGINMRTGAHGKNKDNQY
jgi:hypothetical protein